MDHKVTMSTYTINLGWVLVPSQLPRTTATTGTPPVPAPITAIATETEIEETEETESETETVLIPQLTYPNIRSFKSYLLPRWMLI